MMKNDFLLYFIVARLVIPLIRYLNKGDKGNVEG